MADKKSVNEREYVIPLRQAWMKKPNYKRSRAGVMEIKRFIAKHMKVADRDFDKVKLDVYLNNEIWFRGSRKPPAKVKVLAKREGDIVKVELAEMHEAVKFKKSKLDKRDKPSDKKVVEKSEDKSEKSEDQKKDEEEKEKSVAALREKQADMDAKAQKHMVKTESRKDVQQRKSLSR